MGTWVRILSVALWYGKVPGLLRVKVYEAEPAAGTSAVNLPGVPVVVVGLRPGTKNDTGSPRQFRRLTVRVPAAVVVAIVGPTSQTGTSVQA